MTPPMTSGAEVRPLADLLRRLGDVLVRIPDVAFTGWDRMPGRRMPEEPIPRLVPDLAIEVLSRTNTPGEGDILDGAPVLPGFTLPVATLFAELDRQG